MSNPITIAVVDDYDVVVLGVARMLEQYPDRVRVAELSTTQTVDQPVDIVLYDAFAQPETDTSTPGTSTTSSSPRRGSSGCTATSPRPFLRATSSGAWSGCTPARWW
jgi:DNA-binding NarL/FixJ family response regulator